MASSIPRSRRRWTSRKKPWRHKWERRSESCGSALDPGYRTAKLFDRAAELRLGPDAFSKQFHLVLLLLVVADRREFHPAADGLVVEPPVDRAAALTEADVLRGERACRRLDRLGSDGRALDALFCGLHLERAVHVPHGPLLRHHHLLRL